MPIRPNLTGLPPRFRLTRMATTGHINDLLLDATGPLADLHARVLEAGCEVNPAWKLGSGDTVPWDVAKIFW